MTAILFVIFCVSAWRLFSYYRNSAREEEAFALLARQAAEGEELASQEPALGKPALPQFFQAQDSMRSAYAALHEKNPDLFGWIRIRDTKLDYPVMHTPADPEHYLHRAFDGSYALSGVPFLDGNCYEGCGNYLIYGHKMKSGTMFSILLSYDDQEFWRKHPVISFDTLNGQGEYEVLAAFYAEIYPQNQSDGFRYYQYTDLTDEAVFEEYLAQVQDAALYDTGVTAEYGDSLITLSTCSYHTENGRFVVVARKAADEDRQP